MLLDQIKHYQVQMLGKLKMNLSHLYYLEQYINNNPVEGKECKLLQEIGYIKDNKVTVLGLNMYNAWITMEEPVEKKKVVKVKSVQEDNGWDLFWGKYPGKAAFEYKGKKFCSERAMKSDKQIAQQLYNKCLQEDVLTPEALLNAMLVEVETRKIESYKQGKNILQYMPGIVPYLRGKKYEVYLGEEMPDQPKEKLVYVNSTDQ